VSRDLWANDPDRTTRREAPALRCIGCNTTAGVEMRTTADRHDGKAFARCQSCADEREKSVRSNLELSSPVPPRWFDPAYAGERWDDE
jgi:transcription elongation factor Elf1